MPRDHRMGAQNLYYSIDSLIFFVLVFFLRLA